MARRVVARSDLAKCTGPPSLTATARQSSRHRFAASEDWTYVKFFISHDGTPSRSSQRPREMHGPAFADGYGAAVFATPLRCERRLDIREVFHLPRWHAES